MNRSEAINEIKERNRLIQDNRRSVGNYKNIGMVWGYCIFTGVTIATLIALWNTL